MAPKAQVASQTPQAVHFSLSIFSMRIHPQSLPALVGRPLQVGTQAFHQLVDLFRH